MGYSFLINGDACMTKYYNSKRTRNIYKPNSSEPFKLSRSKLEREKDGSAYRLYSLKEEIEIVEGL